MGKANYLNRKLNVSVDNVNIGDVGLVDENENPISKTNPLSVTERSADAIRTAIDSVNTSIEYIGRAIPGSITSSAVWQIKRITDSATGSIIEYADGNNNFDNIWDNRESLSYS